MKLAWILALTAAVSVSTSSAAAPTAKSADRAAVAEVERLAAQALAAYKIGDFAAAIAGYAQAYELSPEPALLYNIALIYDRDLGDLTATERYLQRVVDSDNADPLIVGRASKRLRRLRRRRPSPPAESEPAKAEAAAVEKPSDDASAPEQSDDPAAQTDASPPPPEAAATPPPQPEAPDVPTLASHQHAKTTARRGGLGWSTLLGGLTTLGVGAGVGAWAWRSHDEFARSALLSDKLNARRIAQRRARTADAIMGAGLLTTGIGLVLVLVGGDDDATVDTPAATHATSGGETRLHWTVGFTERGAMGLLRVVMP